MARSRGREGWLWGVLLALALAGGVAGFAQWIERGGNEPEPEALVLGDPGMPLGDPLEDRPGVLPEGFVPNLPQVPTLPPGAHADRAIGAGATDDDRMDELAAEMRLVREARGMIEEDPGSALQLLDQHRERYPQGALREEREVYAIEALVALRHTAEVERRYMEFRDDFPDSTFLPRLERSME